jgi:hypothetical protein
MSTRPPPPPDPLDFVEDLLAAEELEELAGKPVAELDASIREGGQDPALADAIFERVLADRRGAAMLRAVDEAPARSKEAPASRRTRGSTVPPPGSKVVPLVAARARRRTLAPWLLAAAMFIAVLDVAFTHRKAIVAYFEPAPPPAPPAPWPPPSPAPTPAEIAADIRAGALRDCAKLLFDACQTGLDRAKDLDPQGENAPEVKEARDAIAAGLDAGAFEGAKPGDEPPPPGNGQRPSGKEGGAPRKNR